LKEIKPYHVFAFVAGVLFILSPLVYFAPDKGYNLGFMHLNFLTAQEFLHPVKQEKKDISAIVANIDTTAIDADIDPLMKHTNGSNGNMGAPSGGQMNTESNTELLLNDQARNQLHQLFSKMDKVAADKKKLHILHYGDSQIEGDRMTAYIRQRIQNQFGGNGPGLIPAMNVYHTNTFKQTFSENFRRYTCFGGEKLKNKKYGVLGSAARFTADSDSLLKVASTSQEAWIEFEPHKSAYSRSKEFNNVTMYYNSCLKPCLLKVYQNGSLIHEDSLVTDGKAHEVHLSFPSTPGKLKYVFNGVYSPNISGFSLEGDYGVQVSNIGMRGSSGTIFGSMDQTLLSNMYADLNTELVIMQFGGNSVPAFKDSAGVRNYARYFKGQLNTLKKLRPSTAIVVIGPSDMSIPDNGNFITYPLLPYLVEQMKKTTLDAGFAYWDLFSAMGGQNSMPAWVDQGLAAKDYIHFSPKGASIASQMFFDAFAAEYAKWKQGK
jgi:lysophospholipase L1-like esterase